MTSPLPTEFEAGLIVWCLKAGLGYELQTAADVRRAARESGKYAECSLAEAAFVAGRLNEMTTPKAKVTYENPCRVNGDLVHTICVDDRPIGHIRSTGKHFVAVRHDHTMRYHETAEDAVAWLVRKATRL